MTATPAPSTVVVLGFPRSGGTLLSRILDAHPDVSCPPETNLLAACGRFLRESHGEGPPLGVLPGLRLAGIEEEFAVDALRRLFFAAQSRLAAGKRVCIEKSGFDIFYLDAIERLLPAPARFICAVRHPLDVVVSVKELVDKAGHIMPELHEYVRGNDNLHLAFAAAWTDRSDALAAFMDRNQERCHLYRYEDLVGDPAATIGAIAEFIGVAPPSAAAISASFAEPGRIGLGDWKIFERRDVDKASVDRWRQALPRATAARLLERLSPYLDRYGYPAIRPPRLPTRDETLRQFDVAKRMQLSASRPA